MSEAVPTTITSASSAQDSRRSSPLTATPAVAAIMEEDKEEQQALVVINSETTPLMSPPKESSSSSSEVLEKCLNSIGIGRFHYFFLFVVGLAFGAEAQQTFLSTFIRDQVAVDLGVSSTESASMATAFFGGLAIGAVAFGLAADVVGRRLVIIVSTFMASIFGLSAAGSTSFLTLELSLVVVGFSGGGGLVLTALLMEILPTSTRETYCSVAFSMWTWGALLQCLLAYLLESFSWRWLTASTAVPCILILVVCSKIPESPRYLLMKKDYKGVYNLIQRISAVNGKAVPVEAQFFLDCSVAKEAAVDKEQQVEVVGVEVGGASVNTSSSSSSALSSPTSPPTFRATTRNSSGSYTDTPPPLARAAAQEKEEAWGYSSSPGSSARSSLSSIQGNLLKLFHPKVRGLTFAMWLVWGGATASYYGIIMLTTSVLLQGDGGYLAVAISACGELPCYPLIRYSTKTMGRRWPLILFPLITVVLLVFFYCIKLPQSEARYTNWVYLLELLLVFLTRLLTLVCFDIAYMFSPEAFPTAIRTTGSGSCSAVARVTSMVTPFVAYSLQEAAHHPFAPYLVFCLFLLVVSLGGYLVPFDTKGKVMDDTMLSGPATSESTTPCGDVIIGDDSTTGTTSTSSTTAAASSKTATNGPEVDAALVVVTDAEVEVEGPGGVGLRKRVQSKRVESKAAQVFKE